MTGVPGTSPYVVFGTGPLGLAVMDELVRLGRQVALVNRSGQLAEKLPGGVQLVRGEATDPGQVESICQAARVVYHCAQPGYTNWPDKFPPITRAIMEGVSSTGARLVFGDNLYMYGAVKGPIHEELPYAPTSRKGRVRAEMANLLMQAHQQGQVKVVIGRASDFYGPRVLGSTLGNRVFPQALAGKRVSAVGSLDLPHTYTYIHDFAAALVTLGDHEQAFGQVWHVPSAETLTQRQLITMIFEEAGQPPNMSAMGSIMMWIGGLFIPEARESYEMMYEFEKPFVVDHSKFERAFGANPTPHPQAIRATLDWYRKQLG